VQLPNPKTRPGEPLRTQGGAINPLFLLGGGVFLVALLAWVLLSGPADEESEHPDGEEVAVAQMDRAIGPATLEIAEGRPLPGVGPLQVEIFYLGSRDDSLIQVQRPGVMAGKIYGSSGKGEANVEMRVQGGPQDGLITFTDADGFYRMDGLIPGLHFVRLQSRTMPTSVRMQRVLGKAETKRDFFLSETLSVVFHLKDHKNKDLQGAEVKTDLGLRGGITNEKGLVQLDGIPGGRRVVLDIRAEGHVPVRYEANLFPALLNGNPVELPPLPKGSAVRGRVKSWPGGALPTITLIPRASSIGGFQVIWEDWQDVSTDREGRYRLENVPISTLMDVRAFHPSGISTPGVRAVQPSISSAASADFVIRQASATVDGQVVDVNGTPILNAILRLEAVQPDRVLGALYPGLGESPVAVRLPTPAQLKREGKSDAQGRFNFALGDHPQGTGHLLLTVEVEGKRTARREVKTVGKTFRIEMQNVLHKATLRLQRRDGGPIPASEIFLNGEPREGMAELEQGFYRVVVKRGDLLIRQADKLWIENDTGLELKP
jgi:hypothetical protein